MLPVVFFLAFGAVASLKFEAPRKHINKLLIADILDAEGMGDSHLGAETAQKLNVVRRSRSTNVKPEIAEVNHFAKCAGTYVNAVARRSIANLSIVQEFVGTSGGSDDTFSIGLMRNPFSYLVSLWAFGSYKLGSRFAFSALRRSVERIYNTTDKTHPSHQVASDMMNSWSQDIGNGLPAGTTAEDKKRFAKWVHAVSPKDHHGFVSGRFYCKYLDHGKLFGQPETHVVDGATIANSGDSQENCNTRVGPLNLHEAGDGLEHEKQSLILTKLEHFGLRETGIDCWIFTENLQETMTKCFKKFEELAGPGSVDWDQYDLGEAAGSKSHNPSDHVECNELYDDDLAAFVSKSESGLVRAFGYQRCCGRPCKVE
jgi:hypothetical protein